MTWYLIQTKPRQEIIAEKNLKNQGYECYLPFMRREKVIQKNIEIQKAPLFPRYLFINLDNDFASKSWSSIRSTQGVSNLVRFGEKPARVDDEIVQFIKSREFQNEINVEPLFKKGQSLRLLEGSFAGFESIYQGIDAQMRIIVLLEFMKKPVTTTLELDKVCLIK